MYSLKIDDVNNSFLPKKKNVFIKILFNAIGFTINIQNNFLYCA